MIYFDWQKEVLLELEYSTGSMPLLTPNHSFRTRGGPEAFTSTTIFTKYGGSIYTKLYYIFVIFIDIICVDFYYECIYQMVNWSIVFMFDFQCSLMDSVINIFFI